MATNCLVCGRELWVGGGYKLCSAKCRKERERERERQSRGSKLTCRACGQKLPRYKHKFCSPACKRKYERQQAGKPLNCICGLPLEGGRRKFCSSACDRRDYKTRNREKIRERRRNDRAIVKAVRELGWLDEKP
jgi:predicted nucleic acid-binding Zn ribbon protein